MVAGSLLDEGFIFEGCGKAPHSQEYSCLCGIDGRGLASLSELISGGGSEVALSKGRWEEGGELEGDGVGDGDKYGDDE